METMAKRQALHTPRRFWRLKWDREALVLVAPYVVYLALFIFYPFFMALYGSMSDWDILTGKMDFVGLKYYERLITDPAFLKSFKNNLVYLIVQIPPSIIIGLFVATLLNQRIKLRATFRTIYFMPVVTPAVVLAVVWTFVFQVHGGVLNIALTSLGLPAGKWLTSEATSMPSIALMKIWTDIGFYSVLFLAALQSVPADLIDAARVDGANAWQSFLHITVPLINPTVVFSVVMATIWGMQMFAEPFLMTEGGPLGSSRTLALLLYERGFIFS
ncbi:MAG: sugar ABC transporter permease [Chloroflexota bacterium]|nr:MAG: sugar ABC transporter permease [Chloroflexota bacterium]